MTHFLCLEIIVIVNRVKSAWTDLETFGLTQIKLHEEVLCDNIVSYNLNSIDIEFLLRLA